MSAALDELNVSSEVLLLDEESGNEIEESPKTNVVDDTENDVENCEEALKLVNPKEKAIPKLWLELLDDEEDSELLLEFELELELLSRQSTSSSHRLSPSPGNQIHASSKHSKCPGSLLELLDNAEVILLATEEVKEEDKRLLASELCTTEESTDDSTDDADSLSAEDATEDTTEDP